MLTSIMIGQRGFSHVLVIVVVAITIGAIFFNANSSSNQTLPTTIIKDNVEKITQSPTPTPYQFPYKNPTISKSRSYRTILVGDSIVATLGANCNVLREKLIEYYPENEFVNYNYGFGSTNVLSLPERLRKKTNYLGSDYVPILEQGFDFIIIESFAYNPLSEYPLEEGLKKQNEALEESVRLILKEKLNAALAFMTPIAPSEDDFGRGTVNLSQEQRSYWVKERIAYIDNHKKFAKQKGIPVIDVYKASLKENGVVDKRYISDDNIHPSEAGIDLISQQIANYIFENGIFPE